MEQPCYACQQPFEPYESPYGDRQVLCPDCRMLSPVKFKNLYGMTKREVVISNR